VGLRTIHRPFLCKVWDFSQVESPSEVVTILSETVLWLDYFILAAMVKSYCHPLSLSRSIPNFRPLVSVNQQYLTSFHLADCFYPIPALHSAKDFAAPRVWPPYSSSARFSPLPHRGHNSSLGMRTPYHLRIVGRCPALLNAAHSRKRRSRRFAHIQ